MKLLLLLLLRPPQALPFFLMLFSWSLFGRQIIAFLCIHICLCLWEIVVDSTSSFLLGARVYVCSGESRQRQRRCHPLFVSGRPVSLFVCSLKRWDSFVPLIRALRATCSPSKHLRPCFLSPWLPSAVDSRDWFRRSRTFIRSPRTRRWRTNANDSTEPTNE